MAVPGRAPVHERMGRMSISLSHVWATYGRECVSKNGKQVGTCGKNMLTETKKITTWRCSRVGRAHMAYPCYTHVSCSHHGCTGTPQLGPKPNTSCKGTPQGTPASPFRLNFWHPKQEGSMCPTCGSSFTWTADLRVSTLAPFPIVFLFMATLSL